MLVFRGIDFDGQTAIRFEGDVNDGLPDGLGELAFANGVKYVGNFKGGKRHGKGDLLRADGHSYKGSWRDGKIRRGILGRSYRDSDGKKYRGSWTF
ncbi:MAG: hypothetical protein CMQ40_08910 [Gammaproteobacteria bacterium]|nr:hypothetical protein [Gammaproteobacteria bacterium]